MLFVEMIEMIASGLAERNLVPLLCGASADASLAAEVKERLRKAAPSAVILEDFLGPEALCGIFSATKLNVHPCLYDAYGMSVVEAAAFGAPSVVNLGGTIGATALLNKGEDSGLDEGQPGCFETDLMRLNKAELGATVLSYLDSAERLKQVARVARDRALGWSEAAAGKAVYDELAQLVEHTQ